MRILRTLPPESSTVVFKGCLFPNLASEIDGPHAMMIGQPEPSWSLPYIASALIEQEILRAPSSGGNVRGAGSGAELAHATSILDANADHAQSHHPGRDIAQEWNSGKGADIPRDGQGRLLLSPKRRCDHSLLDLCLKG